MNIIEEYRKIKPEPESAWRWDDTDEMNLSIVKLITDDIDFGTHTGTEKQKKSFYSKIAQKIGDAVLTFEMISEMKLEDGVIESIEKYQEDESYKLILDSVLKHRIQCPYCDEYITISRAVAPCGTRLLCISKESEDANCFQFKKHKIEIKTKSDKFVFMNDIRQFIKTPDRFKEKSINTLGGTLHAVQSYAKDGVFSVFVGNSGVLIDQDKNTKDIYVYEHDFFDDVEENELPDLENKGRVCCDLWWVMGADALDVDLESALKNEYDKPVIVDVEPNTTYILEYDMTEERLEKDQNYESKGFKFYKKLEK